MLPEQRLVSSWDPTEAGLSSDGRLQGWHEGSASSDYWERTEASGNSWRSPAGTPLANRSKQKKKQNRYTSQKSHIKTEITQSYTQLDLCSLTEISPVAAGVQISFSSCKHHKLT